MKRKLDIPLSIMLSFLLMFISCDKEDKTIELPDNECRIEQIIFNKTYRNNTNERVCCNVETRIFQYDEEGKIKMLTTKFDWAGNVVLSSEPLEIVETFEYNARGEITRSIVKDVTRRLNAATGEFDPAINIFHFWSYHKNADNRVIEILLDSVVEVSNSSFLAGDRITFKYDSIGRMVESFFDFEKFFDTPRTFKYDSNDNVINEANFSANLEYSNYDDSLNPYQLINKKLGFPYFREKGYFLSKNNLGREYSNNYGELIFIKEYGEENRTIEIEVNNNRTEFRYKCD